MRGKIILKKMFKHLKLSVPLVLLYLLPQISQAETTVPSYSWWNQSRSDHFFTSDPKWSFNPKRIQFDASGELIRQKVRRKGYNVLRFEGYMFSPKHAQPDGTVPLYSWWNPTSTDNFATSRPRWSMDPQDIQWDRSKRHIKNRIKKKGYELYRLEGYILDPKKPQPYGSLPLFSWYNETTRDRFTTSHPEWSIPTPKINWGKNGQRITNNIIKQGYRLQRLEGFIFDPKQVKPEQRHANQTWPQELCLPEAVNKHESATLVKGKGEAKKRVWKSWKRKANDSIRIAANEFYQRQDLQIIDGTLNVTRRSAPFKCKTEDFHYECSITTPACASVKPKEQANSQTHKSPVWLPTKGTATEYICLDQKITAKNSASSYNRRKLAIEETWNIWNKDAIQALSQSIQSQHPNYNLLVINNSLEPKQSQVAPFCTKQIKNNGNKEHSCVISIRPCAKFQVIRD